MSEQEIITENKLIAEFMGYDDVDCSNCKYSRDCNWFQCGLTKEEKDEMLKYHSSWDWLMPCIGKISNEYGYKGLLWSFEFEDGSSCGKYVE